MEEIKCLKCGRSRRENQAFCDECLAEMEKYPVKPGVVVLLPQREKSSFKPTGRRRAIPSPEEQVARLKKRLIALWLALLLALAAIGGLSWLMVSDYLEEQQNIGPLPGQNYSSEIPVTPPVTE